MGATRLKVEQELDIKIKDQGKGGVFRMHFFCLGITQNASFLLL